MKYTIKTILLSALLLGFVSGCVKEDLSKCNPGVLLKFDYSLNPESTNLFGEEVDKVTVYVFDEKGLYYGCFSEAGKRLTNGWEMLLPLPPGNYTTVTWAGPLGTFRIGETNADGTAFQNELKKGVTHIDDFMLTAEQDGRPLTALDNLYHGIAQVTSTYQPEMVTTVDLMKNTKHLIVTVLDASVAGSGKDAPYEVYCTGANARYMADNRIGKQAETVTYRPFETFTNLGEAVSELNVLRLVMGRPIRLVVKSKDGKTVFDKDLLEVLMSTGHYNAQEDFDREDTYRVVIEMGQSGGGEGGITITVNGWLAVEIIPDL